MFYVFRQNNSGGYFEINDDVTQFVIIEADGHEDANSRAVEIGIYFEGVDRDLDCSCCGDRWDEAWSGEGEPEPELYGKPVAAYKPWSHNPGQPYAYIYYKDGNKASFIQKEDGQ
jgi:hypothetical protein